MKRLTKKVVVYALVGLLQLGVGASVLEASPRHDAPPPSRQQSFHSEREREQRLHEERSRHEREMQRREHESEREWRDRQERENERHNQTMEIIAGAALLYLLTNN